MAALTGDFGNSYFVLMLAGSSDVFSDNRIEPEFIQCQQNSLSYANMIFMTTLYCIGKPVINSGGQKVIETDFENIPNF